MNTLSRCPAPFPAAPAPGASASTGLAETSGASPTTGARRSLCQRLAHWWTFKTVCAWCQPQRRTSGAPWAKTVSHGMYPKCGAAMLRELAISKLNSQKNKTLS